MKKLLLALVISTSALAEGGKAPDSPAGDESAAVSKTEANEGHAKESANGKETICKQDSRVRKVTLSTGDAGLACKVSYLKESQSPGEEKVLWSSKAKADYCEEHATAFVEKLKGMGWVCE